MTPTEKRRQTLLKKRRGQELLQVEEELARLKEIGWLEQSKTGRYYLPSKEKLVEKFTRR